jgi:hypothetical protein
VGGSVYGGDIGPDAPVDYLRQMRLSYGAFYRYDFNGIFAVRLQYQDLDIFGEDALSNSASRLERNLHFYSDLDELSLQMEIHPLHNRWFISPYLIGGVSAYKFNPQAYYVDRFVELQPLGTEGQGLDGYEEPYSLYRIAVPLGAGLRFQFTDRMFFSLQASGRITFFDHLDDVSGVAYVPESTLIQNGALAVELAYRGDEIPEVLSESPRPNARRGGAANDYYYSVTAQLSYTFDRLGFKFLSKKKAIGCPTF